MTDSPIPPPLAPRDPYAAMRFRDFRLLIIGRLVAQIGEMMVSVGVYWELYERTNDALALGLVGLVQIVPVLLFSAYGGYVADRYDRRLITLWSQVVLIVCSVVLAIISITEGPLIALYGVLAIIGTARAFNNPAEGALTPMTVPPEHYMNATTWSSSVWQFAAIFGQALGGIITAIAQHAAPVYIVNALSGVVLVVVLLMLNVRQTEFIEATETPFVAIKNGWNFVRRSHIILASISLDMFAVLFGGATALLPVFAKDVLFTDATGYGIMRAAPSVGALLMAVYLGRRRPFQHAGIALLYAVAGFGIATIIFGISTSFVLSVAMLFTLGALDNISVVIRHTLILTQTPDVMRGRVSAVSSIFIGVSNELGGFVSGVTAALLGAVGSVVTGGLGTIAVVGLIAYLVPPLRRFGALGR